MSERAVTATYTMPAATVNALPSEVGAVAYVAVKGEPCPKCAIWWGHAFIRGGASECNGGNVPPSVLADLNGKTCDHCDGKGRIRYTLPVVGDMEQGCPDCAGTGRALLTIQHECDQPLRTMGGAYHPGDCCDGDGVVTDPRRWTVDGLWPVVPYDSPCSDSPHIVVSPDGATHLHLSLIRGHQITVTGPPPEPGDYIVQFNRGEVPVIVFDEQ